MNGKLCLVCCGDAGPEAEAIVAGENWPDVVVAALSSPCGSSASWEEVRPLIPADCTQLVLFSRSCMQGSNGPPEGFPSVRWLEEECPFRLDDSVPLPRVDQARLLLGRGVAEWRLDEERRAAQLRDQNHLRERADQLAAMDFLRRLALLKDESDTIHAIEEMFLMLFAPEEFRYVRYLDGSIERLDDLSPDLLRQVRSLNGKQDWAWTESGRGFLLRLTWGEEFLGIVFADRFAFPEYRDRYLDLALSIVGVCSLAIENARIFRKIKEAEEVFRKSEERLKIAQAIARLGHWEWDILSGEMRWSDETFRLLGYEPGSFPPERETFFSLIHPDDRERVAEQIELATQEKGEFDVEYRVLLPDGGARIVHGMGKVLLVGSDRQPQMIAAIREVTPPRPVELLGVIQDITDRKELERKLAEEARTDSLTGCFNRRHFTNLARQELARVRRYGGEVSALMLDLDHFKAVNDLHGHQVGDLMLQRFVQVCRSMLREEDVIGRLGGEEFAILLPETDREQAREVAERVRRAVAAAEVIVENATAPLRFTASIGVAALLPEESTVDQLIGRADQALYEAKNAGRNRVVAAGPVCEKE